MAQTEKGSFNYQLCSDLFISGLLDGVNIKFLFESLTKNTKLLYTVILNFVVMLGGMGGIFYYLSTHTINPKEFVVGSSSIFFFLRTLPPSLFYMVLVFMPWLGACYIISGQFCGFVVNVLRSESVLNNKPKYYKPKPLTTAEQRPVWKLYRLLVNFGLSLVPFLGIMMQNMIIGMIPIPVIGLLAAFASNMLYFAYNIFSLNWVTISVNPNSSNSFPTSLEILDRFRYIERNWPYFVGFVFPTILTSFILIPLFVAPGFPPNLRAFPGPLFFTAFQVLSVITAWGVVEQNELAAIERGDAAFAAAGAEVTTPEGYFHPLPPEQPRCTKEGILPYPYPIFSYVPTKFTEIMDKIFKEE